MADRRVKRTKTALSRALLELIAEHGYDQVSIRGIAERADVGYATFFRHYPTKEALLLEAFSAVIGDLSELLEQAAARGQLQETGRRLFQYAADHSGLLRALLAAQRLPAVQAQMNAAVVKRILAAGTFRAPDAIPPEIAAHHVAVASMALLQWWLDHEMPYQPERMGEIYASLIVEPALARATGSGRRGRPG
jgi:AcrR family transcriptional regulator